MSQAAVFVVFHGVEHGRALVVHGAELKPGQTSCPSGACVHQQEFVGDPKWSTVKGTTSCSCFKSNNVDFYTFLFFFNSKKSGRMKEA